MLCMLKKIFHTTARHGCESRSTGDFLFKRHNTSFLIDVIFFPISEESGQKMFAFILVADMTFGEVLPEHSSLRDFSKEQPECTAPRVSVLGPVQRRPRLHRL